ncbi:MAG: polyprenyl synthetase [Bacteroidetes bacterium QH_6_64_77]|nr:MAG: polyprenyl synthetase [Bacteroidetes bacterium QH_6_64_77]
MPDALSASANGRASAEAPDLDGEPLTLDRPVPTTLDDIRVPVEDDLEAFRSYFREAMRSDHMLLDKITQYVLWQKGKRIRPLLVLLSAQACGGAATDPTHRAAALVELLHTATLVHDDVVDDAEERRGVFSINALWKNKIAVLMGDFLLSRGLLLSLDHGDYSILHTLSDAVRRMSEGELLQIEKSRLLDIDEETYFRIISDKTASLISACTKSGAVSVTDDEALIERMDKFGETLGLAFQIRDDLFDFSVEDAGKPVGIDLQEKKMTLPLIVALREADRREKKRILKIVDQDDKDRDDLRTIGDARSLLSALPPSEARASLAGLTRFTIQRSR